MTGKSPAMIAVAVMEIGRSRSSAPRAAARPVYRRLMSPSVRRWGRAHLSAGAQTPRRDTSSPSGPACGDPRRGLAAAASRVRNSSFVQSRKPCRGRTDLQCIRSGAELWRASLAQATVVTEFRRLLSSRIVDRRYIESRYRTRSRSHTG
jgi:hypothetical protein